MNKPLLKSMFAIVLLLAGAGIALADNDAELTLKPSATQVSQGQEFTVDIVLKNPSKQNVISVRSWLNYDPMALQATALDTKDSVFNLAAPGEDDISASEGKIKIGRSNISGGVSDTEVKVATVHFQVQSAVAGKTTLSFYDYQVSELGHTSVNIIDQGFPLNILGKEPDKLDFQLNPGGVSAPVIPAPVENPVTPTAPVTPNYGVGGNVGFATDLVRPLNLKANTGSGYIDLAWDTSYDPARVGFNLYYGKTSGQYARRRTLGNLNAFRLDGLSNNDSYYLAITAFDQLNRESDYSNEVGIIVNQPLSSTAPFNTAFDQTYQKIPQQPQNGPLVGWLLFSAAGLSAALLFGKKKKAVAETIPADE
jgi:hypothetical protein